MTLLTLKLQDFILTLIPKFELPVISRVIKIVLRDVCIIVVSLS
jgi:hypothetical protein